MRLSSERQQGEYNNNYYLQKYIANYVQLICNNTKTMELVSTSHESADAISFTMDGTGKARYESSSRSATSFPKSDRLMT